MNKERQEGSFKAVLRIDLSDDLEVHIIARNNTASAASACAIDHVATLRKESLTFASMESAYRLKLSGALSSALMKSN